jgi:dihydroorotase
MANFKISGVRVWGEKNTRATPILVQDDSMVEALPSGAPAQSLAFDDDCTWISPGFIDTHAHVYRYVGGSFAMDPDFCGVRQGVPTLVDQGGPSCLNIDAFRHYVSEPAATNVYCFISAYLAGGVQGHTYVSLYGPDKADVQLVVDSIEKNRDLVAGIKTHASRGGFSRWGTALFDKACEMSRQSGLPIYVHLGEIWPVPPGASYDPEKILTEIGERLRPGDVLAHPFTARNAGILLQSGGIHPVILSAKDRGVKLDVGRSGHVDYKAARQVLDAGVLPDTLGADMHGINHGPKVPPEKYFNLFYAMSEMAALGIPVDHVVNMVTRNAVHFLPGPKRVSDAGGAGLTIFKLVKERQTFVDNFGNSIEGDVAFYPVGCIVGGKYHAVVAQDMPLRIRESVAKYA